VATATKRKKLIGQVFIEEKLVTKEELAIALKLQKKNPLPLGQILIKKGIISEYDLLKVLSKIFKIPSQEKIDFDDKKNPFKNFKLPIKLIQRSKIVPIKFNKKANRISVGIADPLNLHPLDDFRMMLSGYQIEPVLIPENEILRVIHSFFDESKDDRQKIMDDFSDGELEILSDSAASEDAIDMANEAPIIKMVNVIITQAVHERASDVHLEPFEKVFDVRFRVDGVMHKILSPPKSIQNGIISRLKIMANLNIAENRLPQDGRIKIKVMGKDIDIRVSSIPCQYGERVVLRLLNKTDMDYSLENLGMDPKMEEQVKRILLIPNGIFLVTGPTGSGKSTTLYSGLTFLNSPEKNIITIEDPVEYQIDGIAQMQMKSKIGLTFATGLRAILRQDPDVIMVGEIRDTETAQVAAQAALTGHMVFSTLHTNDSASAVTRMIDMKIEPFLITSTVRAILAQRLVRRLCPHCKKGYKLTNIQVAGLGLKKGKSYQVFEAVGCEKCLKTGYRGRIGLYELLNVNSAINKLILAGADANEIGEQARLDGMITMRDSGIRKVLEGITTIEEVNRVA